LAQLAICWLIEAWREGGYRKVIKVFAPVTLAYGLSILFFGPWLLHMGSAISSLSNTANVWPFGLLSGAILLTLALRKSKANLALMSGPFFSPYLAPYSWLPAITGLLPGNVEIIVACLAFWFAWLVSINFF
jgi:hypothetical protein